MNETIGRIIERLSPESDAARALAEEYRDDRGLLPDELVQMCYPDFHSIASRISRFRNVFIGGGSPIVCPQPIDLIGYTYRRLSFDPGTVLEPRFPSRGCSWPVIDMTGSCACEVSDATINDRTGQAGCGILMARSTPDTDANFNSLTRVHISGHFGKNNSRGGACVVIVGAELFNCNSINLRFKGTNGGAFFCSAYNEHGITSPYSSVAGGLEPGKGGAISNCGGFVGGCSHFAVDGPGDQQYRYICKIGSRTYHVIIDDTLYVTAKTPGSCRAMFVLGDRDDQRPEFKGIHNCRLPLTTLHNEAFGVPLLVEDCANIDSPKHILNPAYKA